MANKRERASKADVQTTELNKLPVPDSEFAAEPAAASGKRRKQR